VKLKLEIELDTASVQDVDYAKALVEKLIEIQQLLEELKDE